MEWLKTILKKKTGMSTADRILTGKKDANFQKEIAAEQLNTEEEPEAQPTTTDKVAKAVSEKDIAKRKNMFKYGMIAVGVLVFAYLVYWLFKPFKGGMPFGICRVFLEQNVQFPDTLRLSQVQRINDFVRIWYVQIDGFGEYRMDNIRCTYEADEQYGIRVKKVSINRRDVEPEKIEKFNRSLPVIFAHPPDLTYPRKLPDSLKDLQLDENKLFNIRL